MVVGLGKREKPPKRVAEEMVVVVVEVKNGVVVVIRETIEKFERKEDEGWITIQEWCHNNSQSLTSISKYICVKLPHNTHTPQLPNKLTNHQFLLLS